MIKFINNLIVKIFKQDETMSMLGRWCHINVPKCNYDVIMRKIDFANSDNNLSYKKTNIYLKSDFNNTKHYTPQEYIDGMHN